MSTYCELEGVLFAWYEKARASYILEKKAIKIVASNGMDTFSASNGWISRFKIHLGLIFRKCFGGSATVLNADGIEMRFEKFPKSLQG
ncbi:hypothetical protein NPIL_415461 [Nephila pilipes]|uniref:HTH CENPB-type domain-containing protein n=1 Tax=Nephila pilipes TaxID=299642 RepID=A0A8X6ICG1_NEPPI|nr:hypothetical protein NPIL_415461 [Nephila pilipes]